MRKKRLYVQYSLIVIFLAVTCIVATVKAFIGGQVFFIAMAIIFFIATCVTAILPLVVNRK